MNEMGYKIIIPGLIILFVSHNYVNIFVGGRGKISTKRI